MKIDGTVRLLAANRINISARDLAKTFLVKIELSIPVKHLGVVGGQCLLYDILKKTLFACYVIISVSFRTYVVSIFQISQARRQKT